ncbi:MAG TPA: hypothetical protein VGQ59_10135 [Cyclobacteriaceae bacterium]|jgi:hypothetical protein|nr:hypothetical protein [Cyclobacteriaceae bacterium]
MKRKTIHAPIFLIARFILTTIAIISSNYCLSQCIKVEGMAVVESDSLHYKPRGNKCEGLFRCHVGSNEERISIINFSTGKLHYDLQHPGVISLISSVPDKVIKVEAHPVSLSTFYRMDATLNSNQPLEWRVNDILAKINLHHNNLGVFGCIENSRSRVYVPVVIAGGDNALHLVLRSSVKVNDVRWQYKKVDQNGSRQYVVPNNSSLGDFFPNTPIKIPIDPTLKGTYELQIVAISSGSLDQIPETYIIQIP